MSIKEKDKIAAEIENTFVFLFDQLKIKDSAKLVKKYIKEVRVEKKFDLTHDKKAEAFEGDD